MSIIGRFLDSLVSSRASMVYCTRRLRDRIYMYRKGDKEQGQCPGGTGIFIACPNRQMGPQSRVLVVDDEPAIRALVAKIIERAGLHVDSARDGAEAIEKL